MAIRQVAEAEVKRATTNIPSWRKVLRSQGLSRRGTTAHACGATATSVYSDAASIGEVLLPGQRKFYIPA